MVVQCRSLGSATMAHGTLKDVNSTSGIIVKGERVVGLLAPGNRQACVSGSALCLLASWHAEVLADMEGALRIRAQKISP